MNSLQCGPGTVVSGGQCLPTGTIECGPGTVQSGGQCVPANSLTCGPGTWQVGNECQPVPTDAGLPLVCGPGTVQVGNVCVVAETTDAGSVLDAGPLASEATSFGINPAHTNGQPGDSVASPLVANWRVQFTGQVSYPLVTGGRVIVAAAEAEPNVRALSVATGQLVWGPIVLGGTVMIAYDQGRVFALNGTGVLTALDVTNGHSVWSVSLQGQGFFWSPPVATNGIVYVNGLGVGGTTFAVAESNGEVLWTANTFDGSDGTVAVYDGVVYEAEACDQLSAFDATTGVLQWFDSGNCTGGGGAAPAVYWGLIWERDWVSGDVIINSTGKSAGSFAANFVPAFSDGRVFYTSSGTLTAVDIQTNTLKWSFAGDGTICTSAAVAGDGGQVFVGAQSGSVYELDATTGAQRSVGDAGTSVTCSSETQSMAIAEGHLFVPAGSTLIAF